MAQHTAVQIVGRSSSHFTRVSRIFAHALGVPYELVVVPNLLSLEAEAYGGNPALKIPTLRVDESLLVGTENICRRLVELAGTGSELRVVWPEGVRSDVGRNAHELTWFAMTAQVDLIIGKATSKDGGDNTALAKREAGLHRALAWLDEHLDDALGSLPKERDLSLFEVALFCLVEHLAFRRTIDAGRYPKLRQFAEAFYSHPAAKQTEYRYDFPQAPKERKPLEKPALDPSTLAPRTSSAYPAEFRERVLPREKRALGDALGLKRFGVNLTTIFPGKESSMRHHHSHEEELVFVLEGEVVLRTDEGEQVLSAGMCAGFPAGTKNGHQLVNRTSRPARYLEIGNRDPEDSIGYPDVDLAAWKDEKGAWVFGPKKR